jgi:hypothetical protein
MIFLQNFRNIVSNTRIQDNVNELAHSSSSAQTPRLTDTKCLQHVQHNTCLTEDYIMNIWIANDPLMNIYHSTYYKNTLLTFYEAETIGLYELNIRPLSH